MCLFFNSVPVSGIFHHWKITKVRETQICRENIPWKWQWQILNLLILDFQAHYFFHSLITQFQYYFYKLKKKKPSNPLSFSILSIEIMLGSKIAFFPPYNQFRPPELEAKREIHRGIGQQFQLRKFTKYSWNNC